jgi:hypothetical protein
MPTELKVENIGSTAGWISMKFTGVISIIQPACLRESLKWLKELLN